jgi:spermidine/putrescine transport system permease protein
VAVEASPELAPRPLGGLGKRRLGLLSTSGLVGLPVAYLTLFFLVPVVLVALYSVGVLSLFPNDEGFSTASWTTFFTDSPYLGLFRRSIIVSVVVSALCVGFAYPLAYFLALVAGKRKYPLLLMILVPFFTSYLLRVFAWKVIFGDQGVINSALFSVGIGDADHPQSWLLYSKFTVMVVLAYVWIPFVALPIFVTLENLDRRLLEAATDLGASRWEAFRKITLPLSAPGIVAGFLFVFIPTIGEFITPALVGGANGYLYGNAIVDLFGPAFDWRTGSVLSLFMLAIVAVLTAVFARFLQTRNVAAV